MVKFISPNWLESLIDFGGRPLTEKPPHVDIEKMHSFHVFKFKNEHLRKLLMDFESQIICESEDLKTGYGLLIQTLLKQSEDSSRESSSSIPVKTGSSQSKKTIINLNLFKLNSNNFLVKTAKRTRRILTKDPVQNSDSKTSNSGSLDRDSLDGKALNNSLSSIGSNRKPRVSEPREGNSKCGILKSIVLGLKSFEYLLNVFDVLENFENNYYSPDVCFNLQTFMLQCYYCERLKTHVVFQKKIFGMPWSRLEAPISGTKGHPYLSDILEIIDRIAFDFQDPEIIDLGVKADDLDRYKCILFDFLLTLIVEIFSKIHSCSLGGRFQMKMDLQEILSHIQKHLPRDLTDQLSSKFRNFVEVYWYNSQKGTSY